MVVTEQYWPLKAVRGTRVNMSRVYYKKQQTSPWPRLFSLCMFTGVSVCVCVRARLFVVVVCANMSVQRVAATRLFSSWLCLLMSVKKATLKVPLLVPKGTGSQFDSLTALISVLDTNSGTDAHGQSLVSPEPRLAAC